MRATAPYGFRYQYLAGGVNTGNGWATWKPEGAFVSEYIKESQDNGLIPVFTYYMLYQSAPGNRQREADGVAANLGNRETMRAYYEDLRLLFQRAGAASQGPVVLHVEPDVWGYAQQRARGDDPTTVPVQVGATGLPEVSGLPDTLTGFAQAIVLLRDRYAPQVLLGYHVSSWGTGTDILYTDPPDATVDALAARSAAFYRSLRAPFDLAFAEFSDRDAGFRRDQYKDNGASWWEAEDFRRHLRYLGAFGRLTQRRLVLWQVPFGNTRMRAQNNTWNHYQDNKVEVLLDDPTRGRLQEYVEAGVVAFLFGRGADGATCPCDANRDGVTNPAPINGNDRTSLNADDD
ncbi:MAG TPA: hypothetical protein VH257_08540, partial [Chloroflexota bacterium]|nr:hypothetical protein [Chloroflexota bacterium]